MPRFNSTRVLITGGASGIGLAAARAFLDEGARVAISGRSEARLQAAAVKLQADERLLAPQADVANPEEAERLVRGVEQKFGGIDILVNNAGMNIKQRSFAELTPESWRTLLDSNLNGVFYCTRAALPQMRERRDGLIVFVSSIAAKRPGPLGGAAYAASKAGMRAMALCLGAEEKDNGIRVSVILPGEVDTPLLEARQKPLSEKQRQKILRPEDVADAIVFVAALPARAVVPELIITPSA